LTKSRKLHEKSALRILDESVHLLRQAPLTLLPPYYVGSLPFILGLLYFWADMSRSAVAQDYCAVSALTVAVLFIWMKTWQALFAIRLRDHIQGYSGRPLTWRRLACLVMTQTFVQATGIVVLPVSALLAIPFGWCYAFYQNVLVRADEDHRSLKQICGSAWVQASLWPRQNHLLLLVLMLFGNVVFIDLAAALFIVPHLLKKFFGFDSVFTLSGWNVINSTFWVSTWGLTYLCLDPLVKAAYVLRCFSGASLTSGQDLKAELSNLGRQALCVTVSALLVVLACFPVWGSEEPPVLISPPKLDRSINDVLSRREFSWRMPRELRDTQEHQPRGPFASLLTWIQQGLETGIQTVKDWISAVVQWLEGFRPQSESSKPGSAGSWLSSVRGMLILMIVALAIGLAGLVWRRLRQRRLIQAESIAAAISSVPDLEDEDVKADDLPANRWLALARELAAKGAVRMAFRALYLAALAHLAEHAAITIEDYKSNREYELELQRRARQMPDLTSTFSDSLQWFEKVWYGMHPVSQQDLDRYASLQERMMRFVEN
jgi:hypothetical protein